MNLAERLWLCALPADGIITSPRVVIGVGGATVADLVLAARIRLVPKEQRADAQARAEAMGARADVPGHVRDAIRGAQNAVAGTIVAAQG